MAARHTEESQHFEATWSAFRERPVDLDRIDTNLFRVGWPKPTIYREHEVIHLLAHLLDAALEELGKRPSEPVRPHHSPKEGR